MAFSFTEPPVLYTEDPLVQESILRLAAVADVEVTVAPRVSAARAHWSCASLILLGPDVIDDALAVGPPRRSGVLIVRIDEVDVWESAVHLGAESVVTLPAEDALLISRLVDRESCRGEAAPIIAVTGGCGGAGASGLAHAVARVGGVRSTGGVLLIDGDPLGGGLELLLEMENAPGLRWGDLVATRGRVSPDALRQALPHSEGLHLLSHDRQALAIDSDAWQAMLDAGTQGFGLTVVDVPREGAPVVLSRSRLTLLVVPADLRALAAAAARTSIVQQHAADIRVVVRHRRDSDLDSADVAAALDLPIAGEYADAKPVSMERIADSVLAAVGVHRERQAGSRQVLRRGRRAA